MGYQLAQGGQALGLDLLLALDIGAAGLANLNNGLAIALSLERSEN